MTTDTDPYVSHLETENETLRSSLAEVTAEKQKLEKKFEAMNTTQAPSDDREKDQMRDRLEIEKKRHTLFRMLTVLFGITTVSLIFTLLIVT